MMYNRIHLCATLNNYRRILLDTGDPHVPQYIENLSKVLREELCDIEKIVVSHWHHDHIGGVPDVLALSKPDCTVWKHRQIDEEGNEVPSDIPVQRLHDGQVVSTEGASLRVIHTPGHTTDHVVLSLEEENTLFSGDTILGEGTAVFEDLYDYINSLKAIQKVKPNTIYPGHGPVIKTPDQVIDYYLTHRQAREDQIMSVLKSTNQPISSADIVKLIYTDIDESLLLAAENNVVKHLMKLLKEKRVTRSLNDWQIKGESS